MLSLISIPPSMLEHGDIGWIITLVIVSVFFIWLSHSQIYRGLFECKQGTTGNVLKVYEKLQTSYDMIIPATDKIY